MILASTPACLMESVVPLCSSCPCLCPFSMTLHMKGMNNDEHGLWMFINISMCSPLPLEKFECCKRSNLDGLQTVVAVVGFIKLANALAQALCACCESTEEHWNRHCLTPSAIKGHIHFVHLYIVAATSGEARVYL